MYDGGDVLKRHIGLFSTEGKGKDNVAELIIDGNYIEFYSRNSNEIFPCAFLGGDGKHPYKVITSGISRTGKYRSLEWGCSYRALYALTRNGTCRFENGLEVDRRDIVEVSFNIPELIEWLGFRTVECGATENKEVFAIETKMEELILLDDKINVSLYLESKSFNNITEYDTRTEFLIKNQPRIRIIYKDEPVDIQSVHTDIRCIMQFFGLLIGYVSDAVDIRMSHTIEDYKSWLFINQDMSYNLKSIDAMNRPRTSLEQCEGDIANYFKCWHRFYYDDKYELIRRMYFSANDKKEIFAEDILVLYIRILEGYSLRKSGDDPEAENFKVALDNCSKEIKALIFTEEGMPIFEKAISEAGITWKFNSTHALNIGTWIASGYLERKGLAQRIKEIDRNYFDIIAKNASFIEHEVGRKNEDISEEALISKCFRDLVSTRNYYSHYKEDKMGVLTLSQMNTAIRVIKALIIMIFYYEMGIEKEKIREIMIKDTELHFETIVLQENKEQSQ